MDIIFLAVYTADNKKNTEHLGLEILSAETSIHHISSDIQAIYSDETLITNDNIIKFVQTDTRLLCITVDFNTLDYVNQLTLKVKEIFPCLHICTGGNFATQVKKEILLTCKAIDSIMVGESEKTIISLWKGIMEGAVNNCKGLIYRDENGIIVENEKREFLDMKQIPFATRSMLKASRAGQYARIQSSRGCRGKCSFCTEHSMYDIWGHAKDWRGRDPAEIVTEIRKINTDFGINHFTFVDSSFEDSEDNTKERLIRLCHLLLEEKLDIFFLALMRAENFTKPEDGICLSLLKEAGLVEAFLGIESFSETTLKLFNKRATLTDNMKAIKMFQEHHLNLNIGLIMFHPYTTKEEISTNIKCLSQCGQMHRYTILSNSLYLYKNTPLYKMVEKDGLLDHYTISNPLSYHCQNPDVESIRNAMLYTEEYLKETMGYIHRLEGNLLYIARLIAKVRKRYPKLNDVKVLCDSESEIASSLSSRYLELFAHILNYPGTISAEEYKKIFESLIQPEFINRHLMDLAGTIKMFGRILAKSGLDLGIL